MICLKIAKGGIVSTFGLVYFYSKNGKKDVAKVFEHILDLLIMFLIPNAITRFGPGLFSPRFC